MREKGVVKWFNAAKGYGFIQRASGEDVFVHFSAIQMSGYRTLEEGTEVEFEVKRGPKGLQAENVNRPWGESTDTQFAGQKQKGRPCRRPFSFFEASNYFTTLNGCVGTPTVVIHARSIGLVGSAVICSSAQW